MLRSKYCQLEDQTEHDLTTLGECPLDQASAGIDESVQNPCLVMSSLGSS